MSKINRQKLRQLILQEMERVKEDALVKFNNPGILSHHDDPERDVRFSQGIKCYECGSQMYEGESSCSECGNMMYENSMSSCSECGGMMYEGECSECGAMYEENLNEGSCGCGTCAGCAGSYDSDMDDDFIPDHMQGQGAEDFDAMQKAMFDRFTHMKNIDVEFDYEDDDHHDEHYKGAYMAKSQLYKVAKYAEKLYQMIPDGYDLEDWMRSKLSEIADDISDVYHALDHDKFSGDF